jgi:hypothetical protein
MAGGAEYLNLFQVVLVTKIGTYDTLPVDYVRTHTERSPLSREVVQTLSTICTYQVRTYASDVCVPIPGTGTRQQHHDVVIPPCGYSGSACVTANGSSRF